MMRLYLLLCALLFASGTCPAVAAPAEVPRSPLAGAWRTDADKSQDLGGWTSVEIRFEFSGDMVSIERRFTAGRRVWTDRVALDATARSEAGVPVPWWPDNRIIAATIGGDGTRRMRASWLDQRRLLRVESSLVLATQQGERDVNILSDYKVSADGGTLTLVELRSTRARPVVSVFKRISP